MADATRTVSIQALWDATPLKSGVLEAGRAVDSLADAVDDSSDAMRRSLDNIDAGVSSTFGSSGSFARSVNDVETTGSRLKDTGTEIGAEFSENLGEAFRSGDYKALIFESLTSLAPALGAAGIGVGIGAALLKNAIDGAKARRQDFVDLFNEMFTSIEVDAADSARSIRTKLLDAFDYTAALSKLGGDEGFVGGYEKVIAVAEQLRVPVDELIDVIRGKMNPSLRDTFNALQNVATPIEFMLDGQKRTAGVVDHQYDTAVQLYDMAVKQHDILGKVTDAQLLNRDYTFEAYNSASRTADALERTAAAAERTRDALRDASRYWPSAAELQGAP